MTPATTMFWYNKEAARLSVQVPRTALCHSRYGSDWPRSHSGRSTKVKGDFRCFAPVNAILVTKPFFQKLARHFSKLQKLGFRLI
jgi:hypothetical protein